MARPPRITNRERILLALDGAHEYATRYEMPRRFSQRGLAHRLGMAQSHVSRAMNGLLEQSLVTASRRRVAGEKRRVNAYALSQRGQDQVVDLNAAIAATTVLTIGPDGTLEQHALDGLVAGWNKTGQNTEPLLLADLIRGAETHDGMPVVEPPGAADESAGEEDISAEAVGLHLELAEMHASSGRAEAAIEHLLRAATLHRLRGSAEGDARCRLAAAVLGSPLAEPRHLRIGIEMVRDQGDRIRLTLDLHELWARMDRAAADAWLLDHLRPAWDGGRCRHPLPLLGHIGFRIAAIAEPDEAQAVLTSLLARFEQAGDGPGIAVCRSRLAAL